MANESDLGGNAALLPTNAGGLMELSDDVLAALAGGSGNDKSKRDGGDDDEDGKDREPQPGDIDQPPINVDPPIICGPMTPPKGGVDGEGSDGRDRPSSENQERR